MRAGPASVLMNGSSIRWPQSQMSASTSSGSEVTAVSGSNTIFWMAYSELITVEQPVKQGATTL
jgi:hypothetical protein